MKFFACTQEITCSNQPEHNYYVDCVLESLYDLKFDLLSVSCDSSEIAGMVSTVGSVGHLHIPSKFWIVMEMVEV